MELTPRQEKILAEVILDFTQGGEPVGSKAIAEEIGVSSATVRNEMAGLIELGLLEQPHTSAGRVPTQRGYREYVDRLMGTPELPQEEKRRMDAELHGAGYEPERLLAKGCRLLARTSHCAAIVTAAGGAGARARAVQFVQTGRRAGMLLLLCGGGVMKSRVFHCDFDLSGEMTRVFFRLFNEKVAGRRVSEITPAFLQTAAASMGEFYALAASPLQALLEAARDAMETGLWVSGQMNLLAYPELDHRRVIALLEDSGALTELLAQRPGRITALIGGESGQPPLREASVLVSRYTVDGQDAGALAVLGPMRMDYPRLTAALRYLTQEVGDRLTALTREE